MIVEERSAPPQENAQWVKGDYRWDGRQKNWVWAPGHWKNGHQKHNNHNGNR
jgi:phosphate-selective porin